MAGPSIRPLASADLPEIVQIERDIFPDPWSRQAFAESLQAGHMCSLTAVDETGRVVGYAMGSVVADEGEILNLAVAPASRGQGTGRALLLELLEALRGGGATGVYLEVRRSNDAAIALYRAVGFEALGVRRSYYDRPKEDALTMRLELGSQGAME
jgi:ribosomal-protein-alanine N-acetyltransferase